ncbi:MAG: InlB B-repeat-containing protein, partial [Acutalibacteraceae bacterium]
MAKNICKRTLSSLLAILMVVTTFCFADLGLTANAWVDSAPLESVGRPNSTASTSSVNVMFLVPETIYLNPAGDAYAYYVDSTATGALVQNPAKTSGQIVFRSDVPVTSLKITRSDSTTTYTSSTKTSSLTATASVAGTARDGGVIEWKATYVVDGVTYESYAYTYVYKPYADVIGQAIRGRVSSTFTTHRMVKGVISAAVGFHAADSTYVGNRTWGGSNGVPSPLVTGIIPGGTVDWGANREDNVDRYLTSATNGGIYYENVGDASDDNSKTQSTSYVSTGAITIDRSRYSNTNQIPYLQSVIYHYYSEWPDNSYSVYYTGTTTSSALSASVTFTEYHRTNSFGNDDDTPQSLYSSTRINYGISSSTASNFYLWNKYYTYAKYNGSMDNTYINFNSFSRLHVTLVDKSSLRSTYRLACTLAVESSNSYAGYSAFKTALQTAGTVLGNPKATASEISSAQSTLNSAYNTLKGQLAAVPAVYGAPDIYFYVPETIYVNPANGTAFQYFIDRNNGVNSALRTSSNTTGNIYFHCTDTSATVTGLTVTCDTGFTAPSIAATTSSNNTLATTTSGGSLSSALGSGGTTQLTWTVSYLINGRTYTAKAYSTVYRNLVGASSLIAGTAHPRWQSNYHTNGSFCLTVWIAGAHSANFNQATNPDGFTGTASGSEGDNRGSYNGRVLDATTVPQAGEKNVSIGGSGTGWSGYWNEDTTNTTYTGGAGWIHVDTSRYGNLSQIPNLKYGADDNYELNGKDDSGELYYQIQGGSDQQVYSWSNAGYPSRLTTQTFNVAVSGTGNKWVKIYGHAVKKTDTNTHAHAYTYLYVDQFTKAELRTKINAEVSVGRQSIWYTSASWANYCSYMKQAYAVLGNPTNTNTASGITAISNAVAALVYKTGNVSAKHWSDTLSNSSNKYNLLGTDAAKSYTYGSAVSGGPNAYTGYTYSGTFGDFDVEKWYALDGRSGNAISAVSVDAATRSITVTGTASDSYTVMDMSGPNDSGAYYYVPVIPGGTYTFSYTGSGTDGKAFYFYQDANFKYISHGSLGGLGDQSATLTIPSNARYIQFRFGVGVGTKTYSNVRLIGGSPETYELAELPNVVYNMYYTPKEYTVTYNPNGGTFNGSTGDTTDTVLYDDAYTVAKIGARNAKTQIAAPTRNGYTFNNWLCSATGSNVAHASTVSPWNYDMDVEYTANWTPYSYTLAYNGNGATSGSISSISTTYDAEITTPTSGFTRTGYTLRGWSAYNNTPYDTSNAYFIPTGTLTSVDSIANAQGSNGTAAANGSTLTLYAVWSLNT